jgi:RNA polymerase sigma-70 factor (ECF subfamily)
MDDDELIASLTGGDDTALRQLFARHAPWLAARLRSALPSDDVEDVLQETFLAVWKNARTYQPRGTPEAWLWVIARNQAAQALLDEGVGGE